MTYRRILDVDDVLLCEHVRVAQKGHNLLYLVICERFAIGRQLMRVRCRQSPLQGSMTELGLKYSLFGWGAWRYISHPAKASVTFTYHL